LQLKDLELKNQFYMDSILWIKVFIVGEVTKEVFEVIMLLKWLKLCLIKYKFLAAFLIVLEIYGD
jgi:hypothetical protein